MGVILKCRGEIRATVSAISFPGIPMWAGIHTNLMTSLRRFAEAFRTEHLESPKNGDISPVTINRVLDGIEKILELGSKNQGKIPQADPEPQINRGNTKPTAHQAESSGPSVNTRTDSG